MKRTYLLLFLFVFIVESSLFAQSEYETTITKTFAIKDAYIVQKPGQVIEVGTVIIENGLIKSVGKDVSIPSNARVLEADSMYVYAGFIDGLSNVGIPKPENTNNQRGQGQRGGQRQVNSANPTYKEAGIQPHHSVRDDLKGSDRAIADMRKLGFTASHTIPRGRMLPGNGALILLNGKSGSEMILKDNVSMYAQLSGTRGVYPSTIIAVMSKWRELYKRAEQAMAHEAAYAKNPVGMVRPGNDEVLQAFYPAIEKEQSVVFSASGVKTMHRIYTLQQELGFPLVLGNVNQGWHLADKIKSANTPVSLSLDIPNEKAEKEEGKGRRGGKGGKGGGEKKPEKKADKKPKKEKSPEMIAFEKKRKEEMTNRIKQAATFQEKGIDFSFSTMTTKSKDIRGNLRKMIENGLKEETALAALTTVPAAQLGVSQMLGTVETGKIANLVVSNKPYFEEESQIRYVLIDGEVFDYEIKKKKKGDPNAAVDLNGTWSYTVDVPDMEVNGILKLKNEEGEITGTISNSESPGEEEIEAASIDGNEFTFSAAFDDDGQRISLRFTLVIEGDTLEGSVTVSEFGTFDVEGEKKPE